MPTPQVFVDLAAHGQGADSAVEGVVASFDWPFGAKTVHVRGSNVGLATQWLESWNLALLAASSVGLSAETTERALILVSAS